MVADSLLLKRKWMDILLSRDSTGLVTTAVYHKTTHTGQYLCFHSYHPVAHKRAVVRILRSRVKLLSSSEARCAEEESHVMGVLQKNGYSARFVRSHAFPRQWSTAADAPPKSSGGGSCTAFLVPTARGSAPGRLADPSSNGC